MTITRSSNSVKHMRHRAPHSGAAFNFAFNALAGGIDNDLAVKGTRLSGFKVVDYTPDVLIEFEAGAFMHADLTGDHRGLIVEERNSIELDTAEMTAGSALTLWGWSNDPLPSGDGGNAQYAVAASSSPPVAHAVPLAYTDSGTVSGPWHWKNTAPGGLVSLRDELDASRERGSTRDFFHVAQNYHGVHSPYLFMTFQDFGSTDGSYGAWVPQAEDEASFLTDKRELVTATGPTATKVRSKPFYTGAFAGSPSKLVSARCVWLEQTVSGGVALPDPTFSSTVKIIKGTYTSQWSDPTVSPVLSFTGASEYDVDKVYSGPLFDFSINSVGVEIEAPVNVRFQRMILLVRLTA